MKSYGDRVLSCSAFRGPDQFTATVSIRQRQAGPLCHLLSSLTNGDYFCVYDGTIEQLHTIIRCALAAREVKLEVEKYRAQAIAA
jgi:hypothetical protein